VIYLTFVAATVLSTYYCNHLQILHYHQYQLHQLDLRLVVHEFVSTNEKRPHYIGNI